MTHKPTNAVVWFEIPVLDLDAAMTFYGTVFDFEMKKTDGGPNMIADFPYEGDVSGHLYPGKPSAAGATIHIPVPDTLEATMERCTMAGGTVVSEPVTIPPGRFAYATDPDGNSIGLFEHAS